MKPRTPWTPSAILAALILLLLPGAAIADEPIAKVINQGNALIFVPIVEFNQMILTVTGPCDYQYRQVVEEGELVFRLDETTIDGAYTFNLFRNERIDPGIVEILREARAKFDEETPKALCRDGRFVPGGVRLVPGPLR